MQALLLMCVRAVLISGLLHTYAGHILQHLYRYATYSLMPSGSFDLAHSIYKPYMPNQSRPAQQCII